MSSTILGPQGLLIYDANYRVLICRECQYAIQKSALQSHLLRHKIYRNERQQLISSITQFDLCEPHEVSLPIPTSPAIEYLPVLSGYRCLVEGCDNLCSSVKRVRQHQSKEHRFSESHDFSSLTLSIKLQTFFRGTKLRYFEVARSSTADPTTSPSVNNAERHHETERDFTLFLDGQINDADATASPSAHVLESFSSVLSPSAVSVDLETLTYFHHFTTTTSPRLPCLDATFSTSSYWMSQVIPQALQHRWLMCGLLAISSSQLAALADDPISENSHRERSALYSLRFAATWEQSSSREPGTAVSWPAEIETAAGLIQCVLRCASWRREEEDIGRITDTRLTTQLQLRSLLTNIRKFVVIGRDFPALAFQGDDGQENPFRTATRTLKNIPNNAALTAPLNHLALLPSRIANVLGKPDELANVLVAFNAIAVLVNCCTTGLASQDAEIAFLAMATWLVKVPDQFQHLILEHNPVALVVVAHWAAYLVNHVENCGCWFLGKYARTVIHCIRTQLAGDTKVLSLIEEIAPM